MEMTIKLTEEDIKSIITQKLSNEGFDVHNIKINLESQWTGHGQSERQETVFKSIEAKVEKKKEKTYSQLDR